MPNPLTPAPRAPERPLFGTPSEDESAELRDLLDDDPGALDAIGLPAPLPAARVTAVLVAHDGETWLPACLAALDAQSRAPDQLVLVDTGSTDASPALLAGHGATARVQAARDSGYGAAVAAGLAAAPPSPAGTDAPTAWVWLLHDDCAPEPTALEELLRAAGATTGAGVLGPKVRDWDDPRVLVDIGLTVDHGGRRVTGLEARELDQGQHDSQRDVLAVGTAGALVRRATWDALGGTDPALPFFRDDVDLGWRTVLAGQRVLFVPTAVVLHARAVATGRRPAVAAPGPPRRADRRHAQHVRLANAGLGALLVALPRVVVAGLLRALGLLLTRRPHLARDEVAAIADLALHPLRLASARRRRRRAPRRDGDVHGLLAPRAAGLRAVVGAGGDWVTGGRLARPPDAGGALETGPTAEDLEVLPADDVGRVRRLLTQPALLLPLALAALTVVAGRHLVGGAGLLHGGRLLPPDLRADDLWSRWAATWHPGQGGGSPTPTAPWTPWLALLAQLLGGSVSLAVGVILLGTVPAAGLVAYLAAGRLTRRRGARAWAAATYALLPVSTATLAQGRFDTAVALVALPGLVAGGARLLLEDPRRGGWRRAWTLGVVLAGVAAFDPPVALLAAALLVPAALVTLATRGARRAVAALVPLVPVPLLALPWLARGLADPGVFLTGLGRPGGVAGIPVGQVPQGADLLLLRPGTPSAAGLPPSWVLVPVLVGAAAGLLRGAARRRDGAAALWLVAVVGLAGALLAGRLHVPRVDGTDAAGWGGAGVGLAGVGVLGALLLASQGLRVGLRTKAFGWRQLTVAVLAVVTLPVPLLLAGAWVGRGDAGPLERSVVALLPPDVQADAAGDGSQRVLVLRALPGGDLRFTVTGLTGPHLGDEELVAAPAAQDLLRALVRDLATPRGTDAAETLTTYDVRTVAVLGAARSPLTDALDTQPALARRPTRSYDVSLWQTTVPTGRVQLLPPALAAVAAAPAPPTAGTGRGPSGAALAAAPPVVLAQAGEGAVADIPAGPPGRSVVLAEAADPGWRATLDGTPLTPGRGWGWAQAFALPAAGGQLVVTRDSRHRHLLLALQAVALALVLVLAAPALGRDRTTLDGIDETDETDETDEVSSGTPA